jgi:hypothetical protein
MTAAGAHIGGELIPDILVKSSNALVAQAANITHATTFKITASAERNCQAVASGPPGGLGENPATLALQVKFDRWEWEPFGRLVRQSKAVMGAGRSLKRRHDLT